MASRDRQAPRKVLEAARELSPGHDSAAHQESREVGQSPPLPAVLTGMLNGDTQDLTPIRPLPFACRDVELDAHQREAVARALATTDICLIRGLPGTGKSRVVAELILQAADRGQRVLLAGLTSAGIDRVLELVHGGDEMCAIRCLGPDERQDNLAPFIQALTFDERAKRLSASSLEKARQSLAECRLHIQGLRELQPLWIQVQEWASQLRGLDSQINNAKCARAAVAEEVEREATVAGASDPGLRPAGANAFLADCTAALRRCRDQQTGIESARAVLREKIDLRQKEAADRQAQLEKLRPLMELKQTWHWWRPAWWKALLQQNPFPECNSLQDQLRQIQTKLTELDQDRQSLNRQWVESEKNLQEEFQQRKENEIRQRESELDQRLANLDHDRNVCRSKINAALHTLDPECPAPLPDILDAVEAGHTRWHREVQEQEQQLQLLHNWIACLAETKPWPQLLGKYANVIAGTVSTLAVNERFGCQTVDKPAYDLLVLQEADQITETDFLKIAAVARRWVLVGEPGVDRGAERVYDRLWRHLHWEPRHLPYTWHQEKDRLCCRLRPVAADQKQLLETERVADYPDIELRILALPGAEPALAEVVFPAGFSIVDAKSYLFRELQELTVYTSGHNVFWIEELNRVILRLVDDPIPHTDSVTLEPGVRELVESWHSQPTGNSPLTIHHRTCCLEFDRTAGWDRQRAEDWVWQHLRIRDLGRTIRLDVPHRMHPDLAAFLSNLVFGGEYRIVANGVAGDPTASANGACAVEFVPVPSMLNGGGSRLSKDGTASSAKAKISFLSGKGGAGLEIDLADPRQRNRLPADLPAQLPSQGLINYREALAVVQYLERLAGDPAPVGGPWGVVRGASNTGRLAAREIRPVIAVIALYSSQAALIRKLIQNSSKLAAASFELIVDVPGAFRERECSWVLLSLTRSHSHRPVTFGDGPEMLAMALTRALSHLVLFGDAGTLARRGQWHGPLENLDKSAAGWERELVANLVNYLEGRGDHPRAFQLREGVGP